MPSDQIQRTWFVERGVAASCGSWKPEAVIWPAWCPTDVPNSRSSMATFTALERVHAYWDRSADRIREAAKWMATVIGLALATLIGTSPFADLSARHPGAWFWVTGLIGLICLALTLLLLTDVLLPSITSYDAIQMSDRGSRRGKRKIQRRITVHNGPLQAWKQQVESQQDLWLPSGVKCLVTLREAMVIDELTLTALSEAESKAAKIGLDQQLHVREAQQILVSRLRTWRAAASRIVLIGELYRVRHRAQRAIYLGIPLGVMGALSIVVAFAQLAPAAGR